MQSILIVEPSEVFRSELARELQKQYQVFCCGDSDEGAKLLKAHRPDGLILNLSLHGMDGLRFLEMMETPRPRAIITLSSVYPPYVLQALKDLGVSYSVLIPCTIHAVAHRMNDILCRLSPAVPPDAQEIVAEHLRILKIPTRRGYQMLRVGVPLFAQDRTQSMTKDLYPAIAVLCNCNNWKQVESDIRDLIHCSWEQRDNEIWANYFSDTSRCPTNKKFISRLSEFLDT